MQNRLFQVSGVRHVRIYHGESVPGHTQWPVSWRTPNGDIYVSFQEVTGDVSRKSGYEYVKPEYRSQFRIEQKTLCSHDGGISYNPFWTKPTEPYGFFMPLKHSSSDNLLQAVCRPKAFPEFADSPSRSVLFIESEDQGIHFRKKSRIERAGEVLVPGDLKRFGKMLLVSCYTVSGKSLLFHSNDNGASWNDPCEIAVPHDNMSFHEPAVEPLNETQLLCVMRTHREDIPKHNGINYHSVVMTWNGHGFVHGELADTGIGFRGRPQLLKTSDGVLILAAPGHLLAFSGNDGFTWELDLRTMSDIPPVIYRDEPFRGNAYSHNADPSLMELSDGTVLCTYFIGSDYPFPPPVDEYIGATFFKTRIDR